MFHGTIRSYFSLAIMIVLIMFSSQPSRAAVVVLDFEDTAGMTISTSNYLNQGFRLSPNCHIDGRGGYPGNESRWIGFDAAGCDTNFNSDFLGPPELRGPIPLPYYGARGALWMDFSGSSFSLRSIEIKDFGGWTVTSSRGGFFDSAGIPNSVFNPDPSAPINSDLVINFHGSEWNHIEWLLFFGGSGAPMGFDNLVLSVPEPSTFFLLLVGVTLLIIRQRKRRHVEMPNLVDLRNGACLSRGITNATSNFLTVLSKRISKT